MSGLRRRRGSGLGRGPALGLGAVLLVAALRAAAQQPVKIQRFPSPGSGLQASGGYEPAALSSVALLESDVAMQEAMMSFARTGDKGAYRAAVFGAAEKGDIAAELQVAEQSIPEQCNYEPDRDVPHCGGSGAATGGFGTNPLGIEPSYEEAARWLEKASAQGSGEVSEVLAQLITRMQTNGHGTPYTQADSTRLHGLARLQGFDVQATDVTCYRRVPGGGGPMQTGLPHAMAGALPVQPFTAAELDALRRAGVDGALEYGGGPGLGESVLLTRPEGPVVQVRIILDHDPGMEVLLPIPAHHDTIYVQRGDGFVVFPGGGSVLPRFINLEPQTQPQTQTQTLRQVSVSVQQMDGGHVGGYCTRFP